MRPAAWATPSPTDNIGDSYVTLISTEIVPQGGWEMDALFHQQEASTWKYNFAFLSPGDAGLKYQWAETNDFEVGVWTHLVAVVDSDAMKLQFYENGVLSDENPITSLILPGNSTLYLGTWSEGGRYFVGDLDDIVIYGRALTRTEVGRSTRSQLQRLRAEATLTGSACGHRQCHVNQAGQLVRACELQHIGRHDEQEIAKEAKRIDSRNIASHGFARRE